VQTFSMGGCCVRHWSMAIVAMLGARHVTWHLLGQLDTGHVPMMHGWCCVMHVMWLSLGHIGRQVCGCHWAVFDVGHVGHVVVSISKQRIYQTYLLPTLC
jgi:hypothetical protein